MMMTIVNEEYLDSDLDDEVRDDESQMHLP